MATATVEPPAKRQKEGAKVIGTHSGTFHADEALAVHFLRRLPEYAGSTLIRTRDPKLLDTCDIVVDVGGVYDPATLRFDHHQRTFETTYDAEHQTTKLSSAGLVYKHFGRRIVALHTGLAEADPTVDLLLARMYNNFVEAIDAIDNGVGRYEAVGGGEVRSRYANSTDLSARVGKLQPRWNEDSNDAVLDARFEIASAMAGKEFFDALDYLHLAWLPARSLVERAVKARQSGGRLIVFDQFAPWKEHLFELEKTLEIPEAERPLYVIYADESGKWRIQAVPVSSDSFQSRKPLPEPWRGLRDEELSKATGIPDCIFIHASGFIGGHKTREGVLQLAHKALEM